MLEETLFSMMKKSMLMLFYGWRYIATIDGAVNKRHLLAISEGTMVDGVKCIPDAVELLPQQPDKSRPRIRIVVTPYSNMKTKNLTYLWEVKFDYNIILVILCVLIELVVGSWGEKSWSSRTCEKCWTSGMVSILYLCKT